MITDGNFHLLSGFVAFLVAVTLVPITIRVCLTRGWVDHPGGRKIHSKAVPRLGGVSVFFATWAGYFFYLWHSSSLHEIATLGRIKALFIPSTIIFFLGIYDDIFGADAKKKLIVQSVATALAIYWGTSISYFWDPSSQELVQTTPLWSWLLSFAWIIFVTNAVNLIDGLDGLAGGVALITALTLFFIAKALGFYNVSFFALAMCGACLGFLVFNFAPAKIFLGDSGSLFLGFMMAALSIEANLKRSAAIIIFGPPLVLALPLLDSALAVFRRFFVKKQTLRDKYYGGESVSSMRLLGKRFYEIFQADQEHVHHTLLQLGLGPKRAVLVLYIVTMILGITAYRSTLYDALLGAAVVFFILSVGLLWLRVRLQRSKLKGVEGNEKENNSQA